MKEPTRSDDLASIDTTADPEPWLRMLRGMWPGDDRKRSRYRRLFGMLGVRRGSRVLEVGCGAGGAVRFLVKTIEGLGVAVGVDPSQLALGEASRLTPADDGTAATRPSYLAMDGRQLGFADGCFDAVFCSRVLVHAPDPATIVAEMVRVLRPGGRMLLVEPDRDGILTSVDYDFVNRIFWSDKRSVNPQIGRQLYPLLRGLDLIVDLVEPSFNVSTQAVSDEHVRVLEQDLAARHGEWWSLVESGRITADELQAYAEAMRRACDAGAYLRCDLEFAYVVRKRDDLPRPNGTKVSRL